MRYIIAVICLLLIYPFAKQALLGAEPLSTVIHSKISDDEVKSVAARVLASAKVPGCDQFRISDRSLSGSVIKVSCTDGQRHSIRYGDIARVDGLAVNLD
jgi:hypothetical protein